jgi:integrase
MILNAYERKASKWVHLQYTDEHGRRVCEKTAIRKDDPEKKRKIALALNRVQARLLTHAPASFDDSQAWRWVAGYLKTRFASSPLTFQQYRVRWGWLEEFLEGAAIVTPAMLAREHCFEYAAWRTAQKKRSSGKSPGINTAITELKLLGLLMDEAVNRGLALSNPARKLQIGHEEPAMKAEMSDEEIGAIYHALEGEPVWMRRAWHVALHTGLRFGDTPIPTAQIRWGEKSILIEKPKGGRKREFSIPLYPAIEGMLRDLRDSGEKRLWSLPAEERVITGITWSKFFKRIGMGHLCFHCTRVTFISRGARHGISEAMMMKLVNHGSKEIHRIYQRLLPADALRLGASIPIPTSSGAR